MKIFERITKRYALQNYYLRRNFYWPDTLPEILDYWRQHNELPFLYGGDNWPYDAMCERQRRKGVYASQYLTPNRTARHMAALAVRYFDNGSRIVDACCGTVQLTRALLLEGVHPSAILGFDADAELVDLYERLYPEAAALRMQFHEIDFRCESVIANPPFEVPECTAFLQWLSRIQCSGDRCAASAVGFYRQAASQIRTGDNATFHRPPPNIHAGAVRMHCLHCGDRRAGTGVACADAGQSLNPIYPQTNPNGRSEDYFVRLKDVSVSTLGMKQAEAVNSYYAAYNVYIGHARHGDIVKKYISSSKATPFILQQND